MGDISTLKNYLEALDKLGSIKFLQQEIPKIVKDQVNAELDKAIVGELSDYISKNIPELTGPQGERGFRGAQGFVGPQGLPGTSIVRTYIKNLDNENHLFIEKSDGTNGFVGKIIGPKGDTGAQGEKGLEGTGVIGGDVREGILYISLSNGVEYSVGNVQGPRGARGQRGKEGLIGAQGKQGEKGPQGLQGLEGKPGPKGERGDIGPQGVRGLQGIQGERGLLGPSGKEGKDGKDGLKGDIGPQGARGLQGPQGLQGLSGADGKDGKDGQAGPRGEMGPQGIRGLPGFQGPQGIQGIAGKDGKDGVKGDTGPQGQRGVAGVQGPMGFSGPKGEIGDKGEKGDKGEMGLQGSMGPQGLQGQRGPQGLQGEMGPIGEKGEIGREGATGIRGEMGPRGFIGPQGLQGEPGVSNIDWAGTYIPGKTYTKGQMVALGKTLWICVVSVTSSPPSAPNWEMMATSSGAGGGGSAVALERVNVFIQNNVPPTNILGLIAGVESENVTEISGEIYRETGTAIRQTYVKLVASKANNLWSIRRSQTIVLSGPPDNVIFSIDAATGQIRYSSDDMPGAYSPNSNFKWVVWRYI